eukprot:4606426-Alexandrium_andersonii.AAC.1
MCIRDSQDRRICGPRSTTCSRWAPKNGVVKWLRGPPVSLSSVTSVRKENRAPNAMLALPPFTCTPRPRTSPVEKIRLASCADKVPASEPAPEDGKQ